MTANTVSGQREATLGLTADTPNGQWTRISGHDGAWHSVWDRYSAPDGSYNGAGEVVLPGHGDDTDPASQPTASSPHFSEVGTYDAGDDDLSLAEVARKERIARGRQILAERRAHRQKKFKEFTSAIGGALRSVRAAVRGGYDAAVTKATELGTGMQDARAEHAVRVEESRAAAAKRKAGRQERRALRAAASQDRSKQIEVSFKEDHQSAVVGHKVRQELRQLKREAGSGDQTRYLEVLASKERALERLVEGRGRYMDIVQQLAAGPAESSGVGVFARQYGEELGRLGQELVEAEAQLGEANDWLAGHPDVARKVQETRAAIESRREQLSALAEGAKERTAARKMARREAWEDTKERVQDGWSAVKDSPVGKALGSLVRLARRINQRAKA